MDYTQLLSAVSTYIVIPTIALVGLCVVNFLRNKIETLKVASKNDTLDKYIDIVGNMIIGAVQEVNNKIVDDLKSKDMFTKEAQKQAMEECKELVMNMMDDNMKTILSESIGDLNAYIQSQIELNIKLLKQ